MEKLAEFLNKLDIKFEDLSLYDKAMTHLSYINEHNLTDSDSYERLEFLGDAVLQKVVSKYLYNNSTRQPGEMTLLRSKLVRKESLASIARELGIHEVIKIGKGENREHLSDSVLEDALEALVGAIEADLGEKASSEFVDTNIS
jgi:ribonuclease-3